MKFVAIFICVLGAVSALSDEEQWNTFKNDYQKTYKSARQESTRFGIFQENLRKIQSHNAKYDSGEVTWAMGVNQFTDLTEEEVHNLFSVRPFELPEDADIYDADPNVETDDAIDWREKGAVLEVLDQFKCGDCYAFSAMGSLEGQRFIRQNISEALSEQEAVDCAGPYGPDGCGGGWMYEVYDYIKENGISRSSDYQYQAVQATCRNSTTARVNVTVKGTKFVRNNTVAFRHAVGNRGPVAISIYHGGIFHYSHGIFDMPDCLNWSTHAVVIVGYGSENGTDYWIMKNSWGKKWGEDGYIRIRRYELSVCGIYDHGMYPKIDY